MQNKLVIFSGLPGAGKSTLADRLARQLRWPLFRVDDIALNIPEDAGWDFWDYQIEILLTITEEQLKLGINVIVDSVFMNMDRHHAQVIANKHDVLFRPIHVFVSDEKLWEQRVTQRVIELNNPAVSTWDQIQRQRLHFRTWEPDTALFVDSVNPIEKNFANVINFVTDESITLMPLEDLPLVPGKYHQV